MFGVPAAKDINFTKLLTLDLSTVCLLYTSRCV